MDNARTVVASNELATNRRIVASKFVYKGGVETTEGHGDSVRAREISGHAQSAATIKDASASKPFGAVCHRARGREFPDRGDVKPVALVALALRGRGTCSPPAPPVPARSRFKA